MSFENILVGITDDDASATALHGAAVLAQALGAALHLVHAGGDAASDSDELEAVRARVSGALQGTSFEDSCTGDALVVKAGDVGEVMLAEAKRVFADLLVVGPHRKHRFDFGSTAKGLMQDSHLSTLIQIGAPREHRNLLVPVDLTPGSKETVRVAHGLANAMKAKLTLLHCYEGPAFAYESAAGDSTSAPNYVVEGERKAEQVAFEGFVEEFNWGSVEHESVFVEDDPAHSILERQGTADMIVVGRHGSRGFFGSVGSLSGLLHKKIESPLLIVPHA